MKVSVIIPTYNRAHFLADAVESVLCQEYPDLEIIIVDDGSTDTTKALLARRYGKKIRYIYQENQGFAVARNKGVEVAAGEYIAFLDSDDIWKEHKLALQIGIMDRYRDIGFLFSDFTIVKTSGKKIHSGLQTWFKKEQNWEKILPQQLSFPSDGEKDGGTSGGYRISCGNLYHSLLFAPYILPSTAVVRKSAIPFGVEHTAGDPFSADWNFFALLSQYNCKGALLHHETTLNRSHNDKVRSTLSTPLLEKLRFRLKAVETIWKEDNDFSREHGEDIRRVESDLLLGLAKQSFRLDRPADAKRYLRKWKEQKVAKGRLTAEILHLLLKIPASNRVLNSLRQDTKERK